MLKSMLKEITEKGFERIYKIDEYGNVYGKNSKIRKPNIQKGYAHIHLCNKYNTKRKPIHRLVFEHFVGAIPKGMQINHIDGNKLNNHFLNLEIVTPKQNTQHAWKIGLAKKRFGKDVIFTKLSWEQVQEIRRLFSQGKTQPELAKKYNCHQTNIHYIVKNKTRLYA